MIFTPLSYLDYVSPGHASGTVIFILVRCRLRAAAQTLGPAVWNACDSKCMLQATVFIGNY